MMVAFKMRDSLPSARYSPICNVLRQWKTSLIPIYSLFKKDVHLRNDARTIIYIIIYNNYIYIDTRALNRLGSSLRSQ